MDSADRDRALDRFVAGMRVDEDDLADAVAARAVDVALIVDALLLGLNNDAAEIRLRAAKRIARLVALPPRLEERLHDLAAKDPNRHVRAAAEAALLAHEDSVEREFDPTHIGRPVELARRLGFASLWVRPRRVRGQAPIQGPQSRRIVATFFPRDPTAAPAMRVQLIAEDGAMRLELTRVPDAYIGLRLAVVAHDVTTKTAADVAVATGLVDDVGWVSIAIPPSFGTEEEIARALATQLEFVVVDD